MISSSGGKVFSSLKNVRHRNTAPHVSVVTGRTPTIGMGQMLRIEIRSAGNAVILFCAGDLLFGIGTETLRTMAQSRKEEQIRVDLSRIDKIDASGLGLLVELQIWARANRRELTFVELSESVWRMVIITKLYAALEISYSDIPARTADVLKFDRSEMIA